MSFPLSDPANLPPNILRQHLPSLNNLPQFGMLMQQVDEVDVLYEFFSDFSPLPKRHS
jgi:hypothetical protein